MEHIGATGRRYLFRELLQERQHIGRVWIANSGGQHFVLKDIPHAIFNAFREDILPRVAHLSRCRLPCDSIEGHRIFVYPYFQTDLLQLVRASIPENAKKSILKSVLKGIAELHAVDIVHLDIKPNNVLVDYASEPGDDLKYLVKITDVENSAYLPKGRCIKGMLAGNENWRSPECHCRGELNKPTDIFSFGTLCIYVMLKAVIFGPDDDFKKHISNGALPTIIRLQRQVSYFGDAAGVDDLVKHLADDALNCEVLTMLWEGRHEPYISYRPFNEWTDACDHNFKDVIHLTMNLDPAKRISAQEALEHPFFKSIEST